MLIDFGLAWRLLTVIPLPLIPEDFQRPAGRSAAYYPLVGLLLGILLAGMDRFFYFLLPTAVASTLLLTLWVGSTGMLHLDGFMDACDGLLPPRDPARRLEIMKDSRVGAFAVVGVILLLLLKFNSLLVLPDSDRGAALIVAPVLGRWVMPWLMFRYPLARKEGLGVLFGQGLGWPQVGLASVVAGLTAFFLFGGLGLLLLILAWLGATLIARFALARLGGLTGDIYGATCEVVEVVTLLTIIIAS